MSLLSPRPFGSGTSTFARDTWGGRQILVYSMKLAADEELAMILGIPVAPGGGDGALRFIDMSGYPAFFTDLANAFPADPPLARGSARGAPPAKAPLEVVQVGSFEASYVPSIADIDRLDPRFAEPESRSDKMRGTSA